MGNRVRIHLTANQKASVDTPVIEPEEAKLEQKLEDDLTLTSWQKNATGNETTPGQSACPYTAATLSDSTDLKGSGADLSGPGKRRATGVIPLP